MPSTRSSSRLHPRAVAALGALTLGAALLSLPGTATAAPDGRTALRQPGTEAGVRADALGTLDVTRDDRTGRVSFVRVRGADADLLPQGPSLRAARSGSPKADAWLDEHAALFGVPADQLVLTDEIKDAFGSTFTYSQRHGGIPVWGAALKANVDTDGDLVSVNGRVVPGVSATTVPTSPSSTAARAERRATEMVRLDPPTDEEGNPSGTVGLEADATPVVYEVGSPLGEAGPAHLAWQVTVTGGEGLREQLILADHGLKPLHRWSDVHGLTRTLGSYTGTGPTASVDDDTWAPTWAEGDSTAGLTQTQRNLLDSTAESYHLFRSTFGRDGYDGAGAAMNVRDNRLTGCPNASWHRSYISLCPGLETDDVIAHEWGHAYTQHTSGLVYSYQPGALNESYSDVWGEVVDLLNQREDDGADHSVRTTDDCVALPSGTGSPSLAMRIVSPRSLAGPCTYVTRGNGAPAIAGEGTVKVVVATDAANGAGPLATDACSPITNPDQVAGKWAYADRGSCTYQVKADHLVAAGAQGVIIGNNTTVNPTALINVSTPVPFLMVTPADGARFKSLPAGVAASVHVKDPSLSADRHRWLVGETTSIASLRDMWNPRCAGNPAAVTDAQYHCATDDNGGVHYNSGVPNRAFSLFVDGGTFDGHTVTGVGLDRAAHVWWRANTAHLTPISGFPDFADALAESCQTLVGEPLKPLTLTDTVPDATVAPLTPTDCDQLDKVIDATELRTDVAVRCNFRTRFTPGDVASACGAGTTTVTGLVEDFDGGAVGWTAEVQKAADSRAVAWGLTSRVSGAAGTVAFAANPQGECQTDNVAGNSKLLSPSVTVPTGALSPRLRFRHQVSLEGDYDGGNVKVSVNDGPFTAPPAGSWRHNAPATIIITDNPADPGRRNPLVGERTWSGYDASDLGATWGITVLDLAAAGVLPGDTVKLRFDLGTDYCGGVHGWAVDDVSVTWCEADVPGAVPSTPVVSPASSGAPLASLDEAGSVTDPADGTSDGSSDDTSDDRTARTATRTLVQAPARGVRRGRTFTLTARVSGTDAGRVRFTVGGRVVGTAKVVNGVARLKVRPRTARLVRVGQRRVVAAYLGTAKAAPSKGRATVRVRR